MDWIPLLAVIGFIASLLLGMRSTSRSQTHGLNVQSLSTFNLSRRAKRLRHPIKTMHSTLPFIDNTQMIMGIPKFEWAATLSKISSPNTATTTTNTTTIKKEQPLPGDADIAEVVWKNSRSAVVSLLIQIDGKTNIARGTGFFVSANGYIVTAGHCALDLDVGTVEGQTWWEKHVSKPPLTGPTRAKQLIATVTEVNGQTNTNRSMPCEIVGVCGTADIAVLYCPGITNQTYLSWSDSRRFSVGARCILLGDPMGVDPQSCAAGLCRDNAWFDPDGEQAVESVTIDGAGFEGNSGSPMISLRDGGVVGIYTMGKSGNTGLGGGAAAYIAQPIVANMIVGHATRYGFISGLPKTLGVHALESKTCRTCPQRPTLQFVNEPKNVMNEQEIPTTIPWNFEIGFAGVVWSAYTTLEKLQLGLLNNELVGAVIVAKMEPLGGKGFVDLELGDIVTSIDGVSIGCLTGQFPPSSSTILKRPGELVAVKFLRGKPGTVWQEFTVTQTLGRIQPAVDRPLSYFV